MGTYIITRDEGFIKRSILSDGVWIKNGEWFLELDFWEKYDSRKISGFGWNGKLKKISDRSRRRLLERVSYLSHLGLFPTHMLTLTWYGEWENTPEYADKYLRVVRRFMKRLNDWNRKYKRIRGYLRVREFQKRGAPHEHILLALDRDDDWSDLLKMFTDWWTDLVGRALGKDLSDWNNGVDFHRMRKPGWNYVVKYATKMYQKEAPFEHNWGNWYSFGGEFAVKIVRKASEEALLLDMTEDEIIDELKEYIDLPEEKIRYFVSLAFKRGKVRIYMVRAPVEKSQSNLFESVLT